MPEYRYTATDREGQYMKGTFTADNENFVRQVLRERGLFPIEILQEAENTDWRQYLFRKPSIDSVALFCRQLAMIIQSGITILNGIDIMRSKMPDPILQKELQRMYKEIQTGRTLSETMLAPESVIPPLLARMVATGEASGNLETILISVADFYEMEQGAKKKVKSAMVYPIILGLVAVGVIFFCFAFLVPEIQAMLTEQGAQLPALTLAVISISDFITAHMLALVIGIVAFIVGLNYFIGTPRGRMWKDRLFKALPVIGPIITNIATARFARNAGIVFQAGIPILQGFELIKQNLNNSLAEQAVAFAIDGITKGESTAINLDRAEFFDPLVIQMIRVGEETGRMDTIMSQMADYYEREAQTGVMQLVALLEPVMIVFMGMAVAVIVFSVMLPLFDMLGKLKT
ncbi:MAG: type II secretion system F family protein [Acidobacteriota bacterium]